MKETTFSVKEKTEISIEKKQSIERELIDQLNPYPNHTVFEINKETLECVPAMIIEKPFVWGDKAKPHTEVLYREGYAYVSALSKKTALKKFAAGKNGSKESISEPLSIKLF